ncbi:MAG: SCP2 sterol-binding domain-containing protein [Deltaproteobacteria bacterium]|nr:SCP2 sterol-binding domain-containing protein [Deltaproteobacteria bacterium]
MFRKKRWWGGIRKRPNQEADVSFDADLPEDDDVRMQAQQAGDISDEMANKSSQGESIEQTQILEDVDVDAPEFDEDGEDFDSDTSADSIDQIPDDPLGEAYDLDKGDVLMPRDEEERSRPWRNKMSSPKEFFNTEILYRYDILEEVDRDTLKGKYRIELKGFQGGVWTVDLSDQVEVLNRAEDADVIFTMQQRDFLDLINGALNPQLAMLSKKIRISGDVKRAIHFQSLLSPSFD